MQQDKLQPEGEFDASDNSNLDYSNLKALIFDVDGTLYRQGILRRRMLRQLLRAHLLRPREGYATLRMLRAFRNAQETMRRAASETYADIADEQLKRAARQINVSLETLRPCVERWMEREPLQFLSKMQYAGLSELLVAAKSKGLRLGVFSDYPAKEKLAAMNLLEYFDVIVCAQDCDVQRFKPHPRGLEVTLERLGVHKNEALYIGDRAEVDAEAAARAKVRCVIVGNRHNSRQMNCEAAQMSFDQLTKIITNIAARENTRQPSPIKTHAAIANS